MNQQIEDDEDAKEIPLAVHVPREERIHGRQLERSSTAELVKIAIGAGAAGGALYAVAKFLGAEFLGNGASRKIIENILNPDIYP